jgi:hypothetical protein
MSEDESRRPSPKKTPWHQCSTFVETLKCPATVDSRRSQSSYSQSNNTGNNNDKILEEDSPKEDEPLDLPEEISDGCDPPIRNGVETSTMKKMAQICQLIIVSTTNSGIRQSMQNFLTK